jgi:hypothetical protein
MSDPAVNTYVCQRCYKEISPFLSDIMKMAIDEMKPSNRSYFIDLYCHQQEEGICFQLDISGSSINIIKVN